MELRGSVSHDPDSLPEPVPQTLLPRILGLGSVRQSSDSVQEVWLAGTESFTLLLQRTPRDESLKS